MDRYAVCVFRATGLKTTLLPSALLGKLEHTPVVRPEHYPLR